MLVVSRASFLKFDLALVEAAQSGLTDVCFQKGASVNCMDLQTGERPLHIAVAMGHLEMIAALLRNGSDVRGVLLSFSYSPLLFFFFLTWTTRASVSHRDVSNAYMHDATISTRSLIDISHR